MPRPQTWPLAPLVSGAFLAKIWGDLYVDWGSLEERDALQYRTVVELLTAIFGFFGCAWCHARGRLVYDNIEGHHPAEKLFVISDYKHNKKRKQRQQRLRILEDELVNRIWPLCRSCHLDEHNGQQSSCKRVYETHL